MTESEYLDLRARFANSRYADLRDSGTKFVDLIWQLSGVSDGGEALGAILLMGGQLVQAYSSLSGACAAHGVVIPPLTSGPSGSSAGSGAPYAEGSCVDSMPTSTSVQAIAPNPVSCDSSKAVAKILKVADGKTLADTDSVCGGVSGATSSVQITMSGSTKLLCLGPK
jgi:hypothetical protein